MANIKRKWRNNKRKKKRKSTKNLRYSFRARVFSNGSHSHNLESASTTKLDNTIDTINTNKMSNLATVFSRYDLDIVLLARLDNFQVFPTHFQFITTVDRSNLANSLAAIDMYNASLLSSISTSIKFGTRCSVLYD